MDHGIVEREYHDIRAGHEATERGRNTSTAGSRLLTLEVRKFLDRQRVAHLATADREAVPHVIPVCYALGSNGVYITLDRKPKRGSAHALKRVRNIVENSAVALVVDHYHEDWAKLGWVLLRGHAEILDEGAEHDDAQARLRVRYPQYRPMRLGDLPVIAVRVERVARWGVLLEHRDPDQQ